ncbi:hypothetical protein TNCT_318951 [Trichonephila clavata]|uniref:Uncharacterized protein n=1 Tax=Trichonephila clavata TaxID=2740835 RepID=A0A8X6JJJ7_TRICU|nr:hypothetical protein TNCT_318951 [Trichonephila clavata]
MVKVASAGGTGAKGAGGTTGDVGHRVESRRPDGVTINNSHWEETGGRESNTLLPWGHTITVDSNQVVSEALLCT